MSKLSPKQARHATEAKIREGLSRQQAFDGLKAEGTGLEPRREEHSGPTDGHHLPA
ncbi:MAG: hypothetical protein IPK70_07765 [Flavobacteriales bacterium]|jgi:hypothetical protein|nr:hypothetical protein [Flavobacteriales bacterium]